MNEETYITKEGLKKLQEELYGLKNVKRKEVAERIEAAKELGDLSENAEYAEAKDEQAFVEGRVVELEHVLRHATIIRETKADGVVKVGSKIKIKDDKFVREYKIVGSEEANPLAGLISNESPIGRAFLGKKIGETVEIEVPMGVVRYEIVEIL